MMKGFSNSIENVNNSLIHMCGNVVYKTILLFSGLGGCMATLGIFTYIPTYFQRRRSLALGITNTGFGLGTLISALLINFMLDNYSFSGTCLIIGAIGLNTCVSGALCRPLLRRNKSCASIRLSKYFGRKNIAKDSNRNTEIIEHNENYSDEEAEEKSENHAKANHCASTTNADHHKEVIEDTPQTPESLYSDETTEIINGSLLTTLESKENVPETCALNEVEVSSCDIVAEKSNQGFKVTESQPTPKFQCRLWGKTFYMTIITIFCLNVAVSTVHGFIPALAEERGFSKSQTAVVLTVLGVVDFLLVIPSGLILDNKYINPYRRHVYCIYLIFSGLWVTLLGVVKGYHWMIALAGLVGSVKGTLYCQMSAVIADVFGLGNLPKVFGLAYAGMGIANLAWPAAIGKHFT